MTTHKRIQVSLPPDLEKMLYDLRKTDTFCKMSYSEILRHMFKLGAKDALNDRPDQTA